MKDETSKEQQIREQAEKFNTQYFDETLDLSQIKFRISKKMYSTRGQYIYTSISSPKQIVLSHFLVDSDKEWQSTLLHELIHVWQDIVLKRKPGHGRSFKAKADEIKYVSDGKFNIQRTTEAQDEVVANAIYQKEISRLKNQFIIKWKKGERYNFLKNLTDSEVSSLIDKGYKVYDISENPIPNVRHCKNLEYFFKVRYCYSKKAIVKMEVQLDKSLYTT